MNNRSADAPKSSKFLKVSQVPESDILQHHVLADRQKFHWHEGRENNDDKSGKCGLFKGRMGRGREENKENVDVEVLDSYRACTHASCINIWGKYSLNFCQQDEASED